MKGKYLIRISKEYVFLQDPYSLGNVVEGIKTNVGIKLQLLHYNNSDKTVMTNTYADYHEVNHKYANHEL